MSTQMSSSALVCTLLICGAVVVSAQTTTATVQQPSTGVSSFTVERWPIRPDMRLIQHQRFHVVSGDLPARRLQLETALRKALDVAVPAALGAARTSNFTSIPATTPGYEEYNSIVYEVDVYLLKAIDPQNVALSPDHVFVTTQLLQRTLRASFSSDTKLLLTERYYTSTPADRAAQPVVTASNTSQLYSNTLSRIQLTGKDLLPFNADKQTAFGLSVFYAFNDDTSLYTLNVTDFAAPPAVVRHRKLMQSALPAVTLEVWTQSLAANHTPSGYWNSVFKSGALNSVGPLGLKLTGRFLNATTQLRTFNETTVAVTYDPPQGQGASSSTAFAEQSGGDSDMSAGAIAGIVVGCAVAAALLVAVAVALLFQRRRRQRARKLDAEAAAATARAEFSSSGSFEIAKAGKVAVEEKSFESAAKLWSSSSSDSGGSTGATGPALGTPAAGRAPTLNAADIQICVDACGSPLVLAYSRGSRVYRGRHRQRDVAIKELRLEDRNAAAVQREVQLAERVSRDANVVQFYGTAAPPQAGCLLLVMEFMQGGDLRAALDGSNGVEYRWRARGARIAADITRGLAYIHSTGVIHRDLKSSNVLLSADGATAKVADIGSAALLGADEFPESMPLGTLAWAAPELLSGSTVDAKADIFSLGVVLWEICAGEVPVRAAMRALRVPDDCPAAAAELIAACMAAHPADRPTAVEAAERLRAQAEGQ